MPCPSHPLALWGGVECTINRVGDTFHRQFDRNGHRDRLEDLDRIASLGIKTIRFPMLWEDLAPDTIDGIAWEWPDRWMQRLQELGIRPIVGLLHHGSGPRYTSLVDPAFPELLAQYARAVAERYPWVDAYTPVNEPLTTARFSGLYGHWYPHGKDGRTFYRTLIQELRGTVLAMRAIREINPAAQLVQTEDLGKTYSTPGIAYQADFDNERRWLSLDILTGVLKPDSVLWQHMLFDGITKEELVSFLEEPCPPQIVGINHYVTSSRYLDENIEAYPAHLHGGNGRDVYVDVDAVRMRPDGCCEPADLLLEAWDRFKIPLAVTEAHIGCTREEQLRWFHEIWTAAHSVRDEGGEVLAVTAWSLFGAYDWDSLLTVSAGSYECGAFDLRGLEPRPTALAAALQEVAATGTCTNPLLNVPGWWRRNVRALPKNHEEAATRWEVRRAFQPAGTSAECPMLLITGASGTLGQAFARICFLRGLPYRLLSRAEMDIAEPESVDAALQAFRPWALINAAGYVRVDDAETDVARCFRENAEGPGTLARACALAGIPLLNFSSDLVFDGAKGAAYVESDAPRPLNAYGRSKAAAERIVAEILPRAL
ncbi:MAG TPA: family 1 glycosylhydrolase, partial [Chthoniobacteraceae bacterium]